MFVIHITQKAQKQFEKLVPKMRSWILQTFTYLGSNPFVGKQLEGKYEGLWATRVWPYRIIYTITKKILTVTVIAIGDRKDVYRKLH